MDQDLATDLISLATAEHDLRGALGYRDALYDHYPSALQVLHANQAVKLTRVVRDIGWPGFAEVGEAGAEAAYRILANGIGLPDFLRAGLLLIERQAYLGNAVPGHVAAVMDRIRLLEGRDQVYGTQYDWADDGTITPLPTHGFDTVDMRRQSVSLDLLDDFLAGVREREKAAPTDLGERADRFAAFATKSGWR